MIKAKGPNYIFEINDENYLCIYKKNGKQVAESPLNEVTVIHFKSKNFLGAGQICLKINGVDNIISEGFRENARDNFIKLFEYLSEHCVYRNMSFKQFMSENWSEVKQGTQEIKEAIQPIKAELEEKKKDKEYKKAKEVVQTKCVCQSCGKVYYYNEYDESMEESNLIKSLGFALHGNYFASGYFSNNIKDLSRCPDCGSRKVVKSEERYKVDKFGEYLEKRK